MVTFGNIGVIKRLRYVTIGYICWIAGANPPICHNTDRIATDEALIHFENFLSNGKHGSLRKMPVLAYKKAPSILIGRA